MFKCVNLSKMLSVSKQKLTGLGLDCLLVILEVSYMSFVSLVNICEKYIYIYIYPCLQGWPDRCVKQG